MSSDATRLRQAAVRFGPSVDHIAAQYTNPVTGGRLSGTALLLKVLQGESSALTNPNARHEVSSTGAKGWAQFMPSSRAVAIQKYGVDPWASPEQAVHAAALHLRGKINGSTGLEGYNPGSSSYPQYILGQKVGATHEGSGGAGAPRPTSGPVVSSGGAGPTFDVVGSTSAPAPSPIQASPLPVPQFAAAPVLPQGYQGVQSSGGPVASAAANPTSVIPSASVGGPVASAATIADTPAPAGGVVKGARYGSPVPGQRPHRATHPTAGLDGYPAYDYMAKAGTPVAAPVGGEIIKLSGHNPKNGPTNGPHGPFGYSVYVRGEDGRIYFLTHLGSRDVKVGQKVSQGEMIGTVGNYAKWGGADHVHMGVHG